MQKDGSHDAGPSGLPESSSNPDTSSSRFQPSANMRDRLEKLAKWRMDQSSIEFPDAAREVSGGHATVSQAFLASLSGGKDRTNQSDSTEDKTLDLDGSDGENSRPGNVYTPQRLQPLTGTSSRSLTLLPQAVAVKKMKTSDDIARVLGLTVREAEFLVELSHENIIKLEGFVEDLSKGIIWLVFPWEENGTLRDFIASAEWEIPERISLIFDVSSGVEYLHGRQPPISHGDLKSLNVLVNSECRAVITDFGSARRLKANDLNKETKPAQNKPLAALSLEATFCASTNTITLTGDHYTLRWAAPELLYEEEPGLCSDIWALGWVAYEIMTLQIYTDLDDRPGRAFALWDLADVYRLQNDLSQATTLYTEALQIHTDIGNRRGRAGDLWGLAEVHLARKEYSQAIKFYSEDLEIRTDIGDSLGKAQTLRSLAEVHRRLRKEFGQAITLLSEALQISTNIGDQFGRAIALSRLADVHRDQQEHSDAIRLYTEAAEVFEKVGRTQGVAYASNQAAKLRRLSSRKEAT